MTGDPQISEDLYTKIALDNKLITRFQIRQASAEQDDLGAQGTQLELGEVLVRMGFISERQHRSVLNACRYREQRDYDKRFGRQLLRMELLNQGAIEEGLEAQKSGYASSGTVRPLAEILLGQDRLSEEEVEAAHKGIQERDRMRQQALAEKGKGRLGQISGTTPVLAQRESTRTTDLGEVRDSDLDDVELDEEDLEGLSELVEEDLEELDPDEFDEDEDEDEDEDDLDDLDDLDEADLEDSAEDSDEVIGDLDRDDSELDEEIEDVDLGDLDDVDLDDEDLGGLSELEGLELDQALDGADSQGISEVSGEGGKLPDEPEEDPEEALSLDDEELEEDEDEVDDLDLERLNLDDSDSGSDDEADLARTASEMDSDVELDDEDLRALDQLDSGDSVRPEEAGWAADAFDDRPLSKRPPSGRFPAAKKMVSDPAGPPLPKTLSPPPATPPVVPTPPSSARLKRKKSPTTRAQAARDIPGGEVLDESFSGLGPVAPSPPAPPAPPSADLLEADLPEENLEATRAPAFDPGPPLAAPRPSAPRPPAPPAPPSLPSVSPPPERAERARVSQAPAPQAPAPQAPAPQAPAPQAPAPAGATEPAPPVAPAAKRKPAPAATRPDWRRDPRVRRAFEKAMEAAWQVFLRELED